MGRDETTDLVHDLFLTDKSFCLDDIFLFFKFPLHFLLEHCVESFVVNKGGDKRCLDFFI